MKLELKHLDLMENVLFQHKEMSELNNAIIQDSLESERTPAELRDEYKQRHEAHMADVDELLKMVRDCHFSRTGHKSQAQLDNEADKAELEKFFAEIDNDIRIQDAIRMNSMFAAAAGTNPSQQAAA